MGIKGKCLQAKKVKCCQKIDWDSHTLLHLYRQDPEEAEYMTAYDDEGSVGFNTISEYSNPMMVGLKSTFG